ncbi:MAG: VanZ family protein [Microbacterium sp.]
MLGVYVIVLTLIALWPVPVDSGAGPILRLVSRVIPVLTYARIEFAANILLFVPLGVLLALILQHRHLVVPIAFIATVTIESLQALMIDRRTPSVMDIIANLAGACIGLVIVAFVEWRRARREPPDNSR